MDMHASTWNVGRVFGCGQVVLALGACLGYIYAHDYRRCLYWMFVACVEATITW